MKEMITRLWPRRRPSAPASPTPAVVAPSDTKPEDNTQSARLILALAEKRYELEHGRTRDIEAKAGPTLGLSSAVLVLAAGTLRDNASCLVGREPVIYYCVVAFGLFLLFIAEVFLFLTLRPATFTYIDLQDWVRYEETRRSVEEARAQIEEMAGSYRLYTQQNATINKRKAQFYGTAVFLLPLGVAFIVGAPLWAGCGLPRLW